MRELLACESMDLLGMKIEHGLRFGTVADFVQELIINESIPFRELLPFLCRLEMSFGSYTDLPDRSLAPSLLRRLAWSQLERVARKISSQVTLK